MWNDADSVKEANTDDKLTLIKIALNDLPYELQQEIYEYLYQVGHRIYR
jgi:hypothetical protein